MRARGSWWMWVFAAAAAVGPACTCGTELGGGGEPCTTSAECPRGACVDGRCVVSGGCTSDDMCPGGGICMDGACVPRPADCVDVDRDGYGEGCPRGPDCDDTLATQTGTEVCDGLDNDCDGVVDNGVLSACGDCDPSCSMSGIGVGTGTPFAPDGSTGDDAEGVGLDEEGALILDSRAVNTHVIWIANTAEGTVSKVDTDTFVELARYVTGPNGTGNDPSRTSVNSLGDVYVANRAGHTVTKISVLGADCPDANGDGVVNTSTGPGDVKPWGTDECVLWNVPFPEADLIRAAAAQDVIGPDGELQSFVWIGSYNRLMWKLDGATGARVVSTQSPTNNYGFALDASGNLWVSGLGMTALGRVDTNRCVDDASCAAAECVGEGPGFDDCVKQRIPAPSGPYGITVDFAQRIWLAGYQGTNNIMRYDPMAPPGARFGIVPTTFYTGGIAADAVGWVWAAGYASGVVRINADTLAWQIVAGTPGPTAKGMAIDHAGKVWAINQNGANDATVITPGPTIADATVMTGVAPGPSMRYTYSDMTGQQLRLATNPFGYYRHVFEGCAEGGSGTAWSGLSWSADLPPGTTLRFRVRTAATRAELEAQTWIVVATVPPDAAPVDIGAALSGAGVEAQRFLELEVRLESERTSGTAVVTPRVRSMDVAYICEPIIG